MRPPDGSQHANHAAVRGLELKIRRRMHMPIPILCQASGLIPHRVRAASGGHAARGPSDERKDVRRRTEEKKVPSILPHVPYTNDKGVPAVASPVGHELVPTRQVAPLVLYSPSHQSTQIESDWSVRLAKAMPTYGGRELKDTLAGIWRY